MSLRKPIAFSSFGGYRRFTRYWWNDIFWYLTGITFYSFEWTFDYGLPGWCRDIHAYWHRARYGWAPRDTWSLDGYLNQTLAGSLEYLSEHTDGCPSAYISAEESVDADCDRWEADLRRWALAFSEDPQDVDIFDVEHGYARHNAEEQRRRHNLHQALKEIEPMWEALWD